jgi:hypothetical protein
VCDNYATPVLGGLVHYPSCTDSIKHNLQFSCIFLWLMLTRKHCVSRIFIHFFFHITGKIFHCSEKKTTKNNRIMKIRILLVPIISRPTMPQKCYQFIQNLFSSGGMKISIKIKINRVSIEETWIFCLLYTFLTLIKVNMFHCRQK